MSRISESNEANQIRSYRQKRGLRLRDVAKLIGQTSPAHLSHYEKGRKLPNLRNALRLSAAIKCPVELLFIELFHQITKETYERKERHGIELTYD